MKKVLYFMLLAAFGASFAQSTEDKLHHISNYQGPSLKECIQRFGTPEQLHRGYKLEFDPEATHVGDLLVNRNNLVPRTEENEIQTPCCDIFSALIELLRLYFSSEQRTEPYTLETLNYIKGTYDDTGSTMPPQLHNLRELPEHFLIIE